MKCACHTSPGLTRSGDLFLFQEIWKSECQPDVHLASWARLKTSGLKREFNPPLTEKSDMVFVLQPNPE